MLLLLALFPYTGAIAWVQTLTWPGLTEYNRSHRQTLSDPETGEVESFLKESDRFKFFWILDAGHEVSVATMELSGNGFNITGFCQY